MRTVGAIEHDLDNARWEADNGYSGAGEKVARLQAELLEAVPPPVEPEPEPEVEEAPKPKPKAKTSKK